MAENETGRTIDVYKIETDAYAESDAIWDVYKIETDVSPMYLNGKLSQGESV